MRNYYQSVRLLLSAVVLILIQSGVIRAQIHQPLVQIPITKTPPVIDGKLGDLSWQKSTEISEFIIWTLDSYAKDSVSVFLCYNNKNIYVAFRNADPAAQKLNTIVKPKQPWDTFLWGRNFSSVSVSYKGISIQLLADPMGTMTDYKNGDISWNGKWKFGASINKSDWTAEFIIPLSDFGLEGSPEGKELQISLRRSFPAGEGASWSGNCLLTAVTNGNYHYSRWSEPVPGKNHLPFVAQNFGKSNMDVVCELELIPLNGKPEFINQAGQGPSSDLQLRMSDQPYTFKYNFTIPAGGTLKENIAYDLPVEGSYYASATIKSRDGSLLQRNGDYWFTIEPNRAKLKTIKEKLGESMGSMSRINNPVADKLRKEAGDNMQAIQQLEDLAETSWKSGQWNGLTGKVNDLDREVSQLLHKVKWTALHNWQGEDDFGIAFTHSIIKIRRDAIFPGPLDEKTELSLARNEYESVQLAVLPFGKDLDKLTVEVSDLKGSNGNTIPGNNIEISWVDYNKIDWQADYVTPYKGWYPDPLIPYKSAVRISGKDVCRPFWITVYAPPGTPAGEYTANITVSASGMKKINAMLMCRVWDFELPVVSHLKTHTWDNMEFLADFYNQKEFPIEWYERLCGLLLKNRVNPGYAGLSYVNKTPDNSGNYDFTKVEKVLSYCIDRGLSRFSIIQMKKGIYTPEEAESAYNFVTAYAKFLREKGWLDKALIELWDEPTDLEWPDIKERAERLKKIDPGLRLQLFAEGGPYEFSDRSTDKYGLNDLVDIWAPVNAIESPETQEKGGEIWAYFCTLARDNAPNFFIEAPAIYQRSIAWYCWMFGLDGFEHWSTTYFWRNVHKGQPMDQKWPNVPWDSRTIEYFDGEGQLIYPGPDGVPYSSIRLENFRDGMEDYEYLFKLRELLAGHDKDTDNATLNEIRQLLNPEDYLLYKYPRKIKVTLENTLRYPDQPERILESKKKIAEAIEKLQKMKTGN